MEEEEKEQEEEKEEEGVDAGGEGLDEAEPMLRVSLTEQVLQLVLAVVRAHFKAVGASQGLQSLTKVVPSWAPCFAEAPAAEVMCFVKGLLGPPTYAGAEVARLLGAQMLGAVGQHVLSSDVACSLPLLLDVCNAMRPEVGGWGQASLLRGAVGCLGVFSSTGGEGGRGGQRTGWGPTDCPEPPWPP